MTETQRRTSGRDPEVGLGLQWEISQRGTCSTLQPSNLFLDVHAKGWSWMTLNFNDKKIGGFFFLLEKKNEKGELKRQARAI